MTETPLSARLKDLIARHGPITVADYMAACLGDPEHGYYTTAEPFGAAGDFVTAPEVSQLFGEMIGGWLLHVWQQIGAPAPVRLVELGPGRGTLMADILRVARLSPAFLSAASLHLVEMSAKLRTVQAATLAGAPLPPRWHDRFADVPQDGTLLVVANEFFDALPIHQYIRTPSGWSERMVTLDETGALAFGTGPAGFGGDAAVPEVARRAPVGAVLETQPLANAIAEEIGRAVALTGGACLVVDYGHRHTAVGDTLQAVRGHAYADVLATPGEADLTAHVNFEALARAARAGGAAAHGPIGQGEFLVRLGLLERAGALGAGKDAETQARIRGEVERLAGPQAMGELFKVLALTRPGVVPPPFDS